jgi:hypothetical protein
LALLSPTRGCGKSVTVNLLAKLRPRARKLGSETTAILPRLIDRDAPTLLLDEADNLNFAKDGVLRSIVNDGFENGGVRMLMINGELREFRSFAPLAFGAIGRLPTPLMSRSVVINMCRAPKNAGGLNALISRTRHCWRNWILSIARCSIGRRKSAGNSTRIQRCPAASPRGGGSNAL